MDKAIKEDLARVPKLKIPRYLHTSPESLNVIIHGFSDASPKAYGACIYLVNENKSSVCSLLVCSKSRIAPIKPVSLPRLELCAAVLLSDLMKNIINSLRTNISEGHLWTDACITLSWLDSSPEKWNPFVSNRTQKIHENTGIYNENWHYVPQNKIQPI